MPTFAPQSREIAKQKLLGALVQLVRIHACHAWGHGFESRTHRFLMKYKRKNPLVPNESGDFSFELIVGLCTP